MKELEVHIGNLRLKSPLMTASGTSGHSGEEMERLATSPQTKASLGAFVTKGITLQPRPGHPEVRIVETRTGLLNSIGLQNKGVKFFVEQELPGLLNFALPIIVNISGSTVDEFSEVASYLNNHDLSETISGIEINVSCPNVKHGTLFGADPEALATRREQQALVWKCLQELHPRYREVLVLRDYQDLSYADIATTLKIPRGTVMSRLHYARKKLRAMLAPYVQGGRSVSEGGAEDA